uniref:DUF19 domain-containing protein n=1 Tax=Loa loa TaxID=7209 RepID=A0A1I7VSS8_LOALO
MTELVVSSNCIDEPGYGEFLERITPVIEDCAKSGMRWISVFLKQLISRAMKHILCHEIQKQCYNITKWNPQKGICEYVKLKYCKINGVTVTVNNKTTVALNISLPNVKLILINFPACIMRTYAEEYCREFESDLELEYYMCLSSATKCNNKREMINECEKEYLAEIKRNIGEIDRRRNLAIDEKRNE